MEKNKATLVLTNILNVIYWTSFTEFQEVEIKKIIEEFQGEDALFFANEICDFLEIQRRGNRTAIAEVLIQYRILNP